MLRSMTGFSRVMVEEDGREVVLELKSVNHRFLDLSFRMPRALNFLEEPLRRKLQVHLSRGHVEVYLAYRNVRADARVVVLDEALVLAYGKVFERMRGLSGLSGDITLPMLAALPDVLSVKESEEDRDAVAVLTLAALSDALTQLIAERESEGAWLKADLQERLCAVEEQLGIVEDYMDSVIQKMQGRLQKRIEELLGQALLDPARIAQEAAILAERSAVDEETVRMRSHISAVRDVMMLSIPAGRKLDFLVQEMHREVNTIGAKSSDITIATAVLSMKSEIEKMREQIQNIE